jgi:phosphatidylserine/phosphatidylglycerophosphate/cardiolipin synthase-like enzyme
MPAQPLTTTASSSDGLTVKLWRGERMVLIGMDVDAPEADFVGFSIEVQSPGSPQFLPLRNRLAFEYAGAADAPTVDGYRNFDSTTAPFQRFRWVHFPQDPQDGTYLYRSTKQHMHDDSTLYAGTSVTASINLQTVIYDGFLDIGFTRGFASSQAYVERYKNNPKVIPAPGASGADQLAFQKAPGEVYEWLGFEAYDLLFGVLDEVVRDTSLTVDMFCYDFNECDMLASLESIGSRLRAIMDDSKDHSPAEAAETLAFARLQASAGDDHIIRMHFSNLQHNKVLIMKKNGAPYKVLFGSTNFSYRGLYIQANNMLVFTAPEVVSLFADYFDQAFAGPAKGFSDKPITTEWHDINIAGRPPLSLCLSPHSDPSISLKQIGDAITSAQSSVFYCIAFLAQMTSGEVYDAVTALPKRDIFSYGVSERDGGLNVHKPDGSVGQVGFAYLAKNAPEPFKSEWAAGTGPSQIHEHNKFVVVDFNLPTARVYTGSCNMSVSGEQKNGDNLMCIRDPRVATSYAIQAISIFDHLQFRNRMQEADAPTSITPPTRTAVSPAHHHPGARRRRHTRAVGHRHQRWHH